MNVTPCHFNSFPHQQNPVFHQHREYFKFINLLHVSYLCYRIPTNTLRILLRIYLAILVALYIGLFFVQKLILELIDNCTICNSNLPPVQIYFENNQKNQLWNNFYFKKKYILSPKQPFDFANFVLQILSLNSLYTPPIPIVQ